MFAMVYSLSGSRSKPDGEDHVVTLQWNSTRPTGLDLSEGDGFTLRVKSVDNSGAIGDWNRNHPTKKVMSGDIVVDVNGKSKSSSIMLMEIKNSSNLHMVVRHIAEVSSQINMLQYRDLDPEDFELLRSLDEVKPRKSEGTMRRMLDGLPRIEASRCSSRTCWICLEEHSPDALVTQLPCEHAFCTGCIEAWVIKCKSNCPICQASIDESSKHETDVDDAGVSKEVDKHGRSLVETPLPTLAIRGATRGRSFSAAASNKAWL